MAVMAISLSFLLVQVDSWLGVRAVRDFGWLYTFGPEGARAVLSAIAGSMITVAGLTFSITMLTLQLASSQFGPRLLRNFMADRGNQIVLGTFIATFGYCLLVLRTVRGIEGSSFVPHIAVAFGGLLAHREHRRADLLHPPHRHVDPQRESARRSLPPRLGGRPSGRGSTRSARPGPLPASEEASPSPVPTTSRARRVVPATRASTSSASTAEAPDAA
jgi:hypothetical protein